VRGTLLATCSLAAAVACGGAIARAEPHPAPLSPLPPAKVATLGAMLRDRDLVVIEVDGSGHLRQLSTFTRVSAAPAAVREVVIHPEKYADFVRNMKRSRVTAEPGGTLRHDYAISYRVYTVGGAHRYVFVPQRPEDAVAPVEMYDPDGDGTRHYRWEFVPSDGGTVLALYGFTQIAHDRFTTRYLTQAPTLESGFALIPQLTLLFSMKARAESLAGAGSAPATPAPPVDWRFLLERGAVALVWSAAGRVREVHLVERSTASRDALFAVAAVPARWPQFVPTVKRATAVAEDAIEIEQALPLMNWTTRWAVHRDASSVELYGVEGDLRGGRLRCDVTDEGDGRRQLVLRAQAAFERGSLLLREVYKLEPFLEYGFDVSLNLLLLQSLRREAERAGH
jgi:hypothetical protein